MSTESSIKNKKHYDKYIKKSIFSDPEIYIGGDDLRTKIKVADKVVSKKIVEEMNERLSRVRSENRPSDSIYFKINLLSEICDFLEE